MCSGSSLSSFLSEFSGGWQGGQRRRESGGRGNEGRVVAEKTERVGEGLEFICCSPASGLQALACRRGVVAEKTERVGEELAFICCSPASGLQALSCRNN